MQSPPPQKTNSTIKTVLIVAALGALCVIGAAALLLFLNLMPCSGGILSGCGHAVDVRVTQSMAYWRIEGRPFIIISNEVTGLTGLGEFGIQNADATSNFTITSITIANSTHVQRGGLTFEPGGIKFVEIANLPTGEKRGIYNFTVVISYLSPNNVSAKQYGARNLVGYYH